MNKTTSLILKIGGGIIGGLSVVLLTGSVLLNSRYVQNKVLKYATDALAEKLQTRVSIDSVSISLIRQKVELWGLYVEDQQQREMLKLKKVAVDLKTMPLMHSQVVIDEAEVTGLDALLLKPSKEEPANYQFVIDAFKKDEDSTDAEDEKKQKMSL